MPDLTDEQVVLKGPTRTIAYAIDAKGAMPAQEFLEATRGKKAPSASERAGIYHLFKMMTEVGRITNEQHFRKERNDIFGFKRYQARMAAFQVDSTWFLTHGFKKKSTRWPEAELRRAERIRQEYLARLKGQK